MKKIFLLSFFILKFVGFQLSAAAGDHRVAKILLNKMDSGILGSPDEVVILSDFIPLAAKQGLIFNILRSNSSEAVSSYVYEQSEDDIMVALEVSVDGRFPIIYRFLKPPKSRFLQR